MHFAKFTFDKYEIILKDPYLFLLSRIDSFENNAEFEVLCDVKQVVLLKLFFIFTSFIESINLLTHYLV